jgi:hypothetical protein
MNDTSKKPGIKLAIDWLKGLKMGFPNSRWVMFSIGVYVLAAAAEKLITALATVAPLLNQ